MRKITVNGIYHVLNRGVDKRKIFLDEDDHLRFIHDLFEFNNTDQINNSTYRFRNTAQPQSKDIARPYFQNERVPRKLLVDLLAFALMPNHYHLLIKPRFENSITKFMKRLNMGYAKYFNEKYERSGALFEGRYKSIAISKESHFLHIPYYIHLNPLDLKSPEWRERKLKNYKESTTFLEKYRWSSFPDYIGIKNFPSVIQRDFLTNFFESPQNHKKAVFEWLKDLEYSSIKDLSLE